MVAGGAFSLTKTAAVAPEGHANGTMTGPPASGGGASELDEPSPAPASKGGLEASAASVDASVPESSATPLPSELDEHPPTGRLAIQRLAIIHPVLRTRATYPPYRPPARLARVPSTVTLSLGEF